MSAQKMNRKVMVAGALGNGLEWYDYALYGHMSLIITKLFFPQDIDPSLAIILTFLTFAAGFISRPLGAIMFGRIGDKYGRKRALVLAILMMAIPTGMIGLLPTYEMIGITAPILLCLIRVMQGLSLGGAYGGSISYVVEHSPHNQRGSVGSVIKISLVIGFLLGSLVSTLMTWIMPVEAFESWGWRIPFLLGVCIAFVGHYIKHHGEESPVYEEAKKAGTLSDRPVRDAFLKHPWILIRGWAVYLFVTMPFYVISIYFIVYSKTYLNQTFEDALLINSMAMASMLISIPISAYLSDKFGRKPVLMGAIIAMLAWLYPAFSMMQTDDFTNILIAQSIMGLCLGAYLAPIPAALVEIFPTSIRYTGMSLAYNICAIMGGLTPAISQWLIGYTGSETSIMYIIVVSGIISLVALMLYKDRWKEPLAA